MFQFQHLDPTSLKVILQAKKIAQQNHNEQIQPTHIALSLFYSKDPELMGILTKCQVNLSLLKADFKKYLEFIPKKNNFKQVIYSKASEKLLAQAMQRKISNHSNFITILDLLVALCSTEDEQILIFLEKSNLELPHLLSILDKKISFTPKKENFATSPEPQSDFITDYCIDIVKKVKEDKIDPIIGRDEELRMLIQVILRRTKNNPLLMGEPGVGKTAIVEALGHRISDGDVPEKLQNIKLLELDLAKTIAGTRYRGDFEKKN